MHPLAPNKVRQAHVARTMLQRRARDKRFRFASITYLQIRGQFAGVWLGRAQPSRHGGRSVAAGARGGSCGWSGYTHTHIRARARPVIGADGVDYVRRNKELSEACLPELWTTGSAQAASAVRRHFRCSQQRNSKECCKCLRAPARTVGHTWLRVLWG